MRRSLSYLTAVVVFAMCGLGSAAGQQQPRAGTVIVPPTNSVQPENVGKHAHTNFLIFVPAAKKGGPSLQGLSPNGETPQSLSCVYQTWAGQIKGCPINPSSGSYNAPSGGSKVIAIVDAYDYPTACSDFNVFSKQFGLPTANCANNGSDPVFDVVYASGSQPRGNCGWAQEAALDIEWSHAMAPNAKIILVEAASNSNTDLMNAVTVARGLVVSAVGGQVSMSWGSSESSGETTYDSDFSGTGVTYFASSGDSGGKVIWPSASPNVISAGGTSVNRDSNGDFSGETTWSSAGGGPSKYETVPLYQQVVPFVWSSGQRGTPDISFDANPYTGVSVYDSTKCSGLVGWMVFGGTSVASPSLAGIANESGAFGGGWDSGSNSSSVQSNLYANYNTATGGAASSDTGSASTDTCSYTSPSGPPFNDITQTSAGSYSAMSCWDYASGIGSDRGFTSFATGAAPSPSFSLSSLPSSLTITQGQNTSSKITVTPANGYTGTVDLSGVSGCPTGATCSLTATSVTITSTSGAQSVTLNVTNTSSASTGTFSLGVSGTDSTNKSLTSSTNVSLAVNAASSGVNFTVAATPTSQIVNQNSSTKYSVTVKPSGGFTGAVNLSVSGLPPQSSYSYNPPSVTIPGTGSGGSASSTLTVTTGSHTPTKTYTLTITGTDSSGSIVQSTTVSLTVQ